PASNLWETSSLVPGATMPLHRARSHAPPILLIAIALILPAGIGAVLTDAAAAPPASCSIRTGTPTAGAPR
ncbi:MAG: hypothetical protein KY437_08130, partial [Actinobacteria bacterium]|nr:hypothetical protein [Actinomycetota bacterium]